MNATIREAIRARIDLAQRTKRVIAGDSKVMMSMPDVQPTIARLVGAVCLESPIDLVAHVKFVAETVIAAKAKAAAAGAVVVSR